MDSNCNGNCVQDRQCDCVPDVEIGLPEGSGVVIWPIVSALIVVALLLVFAMVVL